MGVLFAGFKLVIFQHGMSDKTGALTSHRGSSIHQVEETLVKSRVYAIGDLILLGSETNIENVLFLSEMKSECSPSFSDTKMLQW